MRAISNKINRIENNLNLLTDNFGRNITYLRLSVTDRCNFNCVYCMPEAGNKLTRRRNILTWEEISVLVKIFTELGINKIRLTGGEPFVRKGLMDFLKKNKREKTKPDFFITTNGYGIADFVPELKDTGIKGVNLSIDSIVPKTYKRLTGRNDPGPALETFTALIKKNIPVKINTVVVDGVNDNEIFDMASFAEKNKVDVRFIEMMPFRGNGRSDAPSINSNQIFEKLKVYFGNRLSESNEDSKAKLFNVVGFKGRIGIIGAYSRNFCSDCNRIRVTAEGKMKNCLYGKEVLNLKNILRDGHSENQIRKAITESVKNKYKDGFEAFDNRDKIFYESMSEIGG